MASGFRKFLRDTADLGSATFFAKNSLAESRICTLLCEGWTKSRTHFRVGDFSANELSEWLIKQLFAFLTQLKISFW